MTKELSEYTKAKILALKYNLPFFLIEDGAYTRILYRDGNTNMDVSKEIRELWKALKDADEIREQLSEMLRVERAG
jgi:hypothetical protein